MERFDVHSLESVLASLTSHRHRLAFGAAVSERLFPNYQAFSDEVHWGAPNVLRNALDFIWQVVEGGTLTLSQIRELQAECRLATPDSERFQSRLTSAALDAASAVHEVLEACYRDEPQRIAEVGALARDTVDMFVQKRDGIDYNDSTFEDRILADPLMRRELAKQRSELAILDRTGVLSPGFIREFRESATYGGKGSIDLN